MKRQSHKNRLDESLVERHGRENRHKQSMKDRRDESEGESHMHHHKMAMHHLKELHKMAKKSHRK